MANTYSQIYIQIVFSVKGRENLIRETFRDELQMYISGIIKNLNQKLYAIYIMPDHAHLFISINPSKSISDLVRDIKANSSRFINEKGWIKGKFAWQDGYGAFSYSKSQSANVVNYVINQPNHHKSVTFKDEYIALLKKFEIQFEEKYLFEWYDLNN